MNNLIDLYEDWGKPEKAKEWRAKLPRKEAVDEWYSNKNDPIFIRRRLFTYC